MADEENKSNLKTISIVIAIAIALVIILILFFTKVSFVKDDGKDSKVEPTVSSSTTIEAPQNSPEPEGEPSGEADNYQDEGADEPNNGSTESPNTDKKDDSDNFEPNKVKEPNLSGNFKAGGFVLDKYVVNDNQQYQYIIVIRLTNKSGSKNIKYYATKDAYDGLSEGDILDITYTGDKDGNLAVKTISR